MKQEFVFYAVGIKNVTDYGVRFSGGVNGEDILSEDFYSLTISWQSFCRLCNQITTTPDDGFVEFQFQNYHVTMESHTFQRAKNWQQKLGKA